MPPQPGRPAAGSTARIAVYDSAIAAPRVIDVSGSSTADLIENIASSVYKYAREAGGSIPYTAIREVSENFIHARFREPVVSILDGGSTLRFADQGPGIPDKDRAVLPGFTTADGEMKRYIRGVGSGLPIVREYLGVEGGSLRIDDNLGCGSVVTISAGRTVPAPRQPSHEAARLFVAEPVAETYGRPAQPVRLSSRQKRVLALVLEAGSAGPSLVARELSIGLSTAHRDLAHLESLGLMYSDDSGKRSLTDTGLDAADDLLR